MTIDMAFVTLVMMMTTLKTMMMMTKPLSKALFYTHFAKCTMHILKDEQNFFALVMR